jgi:hypothetical protein
VTNIIWIRAELVCAEKVSSSRSGEDCSAPLALRLRYALQVGRISNYRRQHR